MKYRPNALLTWVRGLFKKEPALIRVDPIFGEIRYHRGFWEHIPQAGIMVSVEAPECGPSDLQRDFYVGLLPNLADLEHRAREFIRREVEEEPNVDGLKLYSIGIGTDDKIRAQRIEIELADEGEFLIHCVLFQSGTPIMYAASD